jgi:uncharacterized SAM-binding protein YcdF (DUF218 family)
MAGCGIHRNRPIGRARTGPSRVKNADLIGGLAAVMKIRRRGFQRRKPRRVRSALLAQGHRGQRGRKPAAARRIQGRAGRRSEIDHEQPAGGVSSLFWFLWSTAGVVSVLAVLAAWTCLRPNSRSARSSLLAAIAFYFLTTLYLVSHPAGQLLASGYRPLVPSDIPEGRTAIVLLGSGIYTAKGWDGARYSVLDRTTAPRVLEAFRLYRMIPAAWIISSGGNLREDSPIEPAGLTMRNALIQLGVPAEQIAVETKSRTTHDEAEIVKAMLPSLAIDHVVLVTTQLHMRRSVGTFRAAGVAVIPAIAPEPIGVDSWAAWIVPTDTGFTEFKALAHELVGILYYTLRGWYR